MKLNGKHYRSIWEEEGRIKILDQKEFPDVITRILEKPDDFITAIRERQVAGGVLVEATVCYALAAAACDAYIKADPDGIQMPRNPDKSYETFTQIMGEAVDGIKAIKSGSRLFNKLIDDQMAAMKLGRTLMEKVSIIENRARQFADNSVEAYRQIGIHGYNLIYFAFKTGTIEEPVNVLVHGNAGWLAAVDYGALAPIYEADRDGFNTHVLVKKPKSPMKFTSKQDAQEYLINCKLGLELGNQNIPFSFIEEDELSKRMRDGEVDMILVGANAVSSAGHVINTIGTHSAALAAKDFGIPFYVACPLSQFDRTPLREIGINHTRDEDMDEKGRHIADAIDRKFTMKVDLPEESFDITRPELITGLITERGICDANEEAILRLYPEHEEVEK